MKVIELSEFRYVPIKQNSSILGKLERLGIDIKLIVSKKRTIGIRIFDTDYVSFISTKLKAEKVYTALTAPDVIETTQDLPENVKITTCRKGNDVIAVLITDLNYNIDILLLSIDSIKEGLYE